MKQLVGIVTSSVIGLLLVSIRSAAASVIETDFPIPPLIQGNAIPTVTFEDILKCNVLQSNVRAPDVDNPTDVYMSMTVDRLLDIKDIDETISISATMFMQWGVFNCPAATTAPKVDEEERVLVTDTTQVWHPTIIFANSSDDVYMQAQQYGSDMQILYQPTQPNRTLFFYWNRIGIFTSKCELNLRTFPFDKQTCDFVFQMKEPDVFLNLAGVSLQEPRMSPNGQWMLLNSQKETGTTASTIIKNGASSYASFQLTFERNATYHVCNLLAPCYVLIILVLGSFLMPPEKPDRPVICCTILLAFVVAQGDVLKEIPRNSQRILLAEYILLFTGVTGLVTLHDMLVCGYSFKKASSANKIVTLLNGRFKMRVVRAFDIAAFLLTVGCLILINLYAAVLIID